MAKKDNTAEWREMLLQYRLNEISDERRAEMDILLISDSAFAAAMQDAEYDLLDAYACGELSERDSLRVEKALSPAGRFSLEEPRLVIRPAATITAARSRSRLHFSSRQVWAYGIAACILAGVILTSMSWFHHAGLDRSTAQQAQNASPQKAPVPQQPQTVTTNAVSPTSVRKLKMRAVPQSVATVLLPSALRSQAALPLRIAGVTKMVRFVWSAGDIAPETGKYELEVITEGGIHICRAPGITLPDHGRVSALRFDCPAHAMQSGTDIVRIIAVPSTPDAIPTLETAVLVEKD